MPPKNSKNQAKAKPTKQTNRPILPDFTPPTQESTIPPTTDLMAWISNSPEFMDQMRAAYEKSKESNNNSQPSKSQPDNSEIQQRFDETQDTAFLYETQETNWNENTHSPIDLTNGKGKETATEIVYTQKNWLNEEDMTMCRVISNLSDKPREERLYKFWNRIVSEFNAEMQGCNGRGYRSKDSMQNRWGRLKKVAVAWKSACEKIDGKYHSGYNDADLLTMKKNEYTAAKGEKFVYDHIIDHLCNFSKYGWTTSAGTYPCFEDDASQHTPESQGSAKRKFVMMDEDDDCEEVASPSKKSSSSGFGAKMARPEGVKKTKAREKAQREEKCQFQSFQKMDEKIEKRLKLEAENDVERLAISAQKLTLQKESEARRNKELELRMIEVAFACAKNEDDIKRACAIRDRFFDKWTTQ